MIILLFNLLTSIDSSLALPTTRVDLNAVIVTSENLSNVIVIGLISVPLVLRSPSVIFSIEYKSHPRSFVQQKLSKVANLHLIFNANASSYITTCQPEDPILMFIQKTSSTVQTSRTIAYSHGGDCFENNLIRTPGGLIQLSCMRVRNSMSTTPLRVAAPPILPHFYRDSNGHIAGGVFYTILSTVLQHLNYTWTTTAIKGGVGVFKNGTWTGVTGAAAYNKADVGFPISATAARYKDIDIVLVSPDSIVFATKLPSMSVDWKAVFYPFSPKLWTMFALTSTTAFITMYALTSPAQKNRLYSSFSILYQITLDQGFNIKLTTRVELLAAQWMFFTLVMETAYRCDLIKFFTFPQESNIPRTLGEVDMRKDYTIKFNYFAGTSYNYFRTSGNGPTKNVFPRFVLEPNTANCLVDATKDSKTVCISWGNTVRTGIAGNLSFPRVTRDLAFISKPIVSFETGLALPKKSPLTAKIANGVGRLRDAGLTVKCYKDVYRNFSVIGRAWMGSRNGTTLYQELSRQLDQGGFKAFKVCNLTGAFMVLFVGFALMTSSFFVEMMSGRWEKWPCKSSDDVIVLDEYGRIGSD